MRTSIKALWIAVVVGFLLTAAPVVAQDSQDSGNLTGTFLLDARPTQLVYMSLTQSGPIVSGYAVIVEPTTDPKVADVLTIRTRGVESIAADVSITLVLGDWVSGQTTMTGSKQDGALTLTYPTSSGEISTVILQPTGPDTFNRAISEWRSDLIAENVTSPNEDLIEDQINVVEANPDDVDAILLLANIMANSGRLTEAIPNYEQAINLAPNDEAVRLDFARALADAGLEQYSELQFQRVLELNPDNQAAMYYLASLYMNWNPVRTDEAVVLFEKSVTADQESFIGEQSQDQLDSILGTPSPQPTPSN